MDGQKITFQELKSEVIEKSKYRHSYLRLGQFVFNYIDANYGVARAVQFEDRIDCFFRDDKIDDFIEKCASRL